MEEDKARDSISYGDLTLECSDLKIKDAADAGSRSFFFARLAPSCNGGVAQVVRATVS